MSDSPGWAVTNRPTPATAESGWPVDRSRSRRVMRRSPAAPSAPRAQRRRPGAGRLKVLAGCLHLRGPGAGRASYWGLNGWTRTAGAATLRRPAAGMGRMGGHLWLRKAEEFGDGEGGRSTGLLRGARAGHELVSLCRKERGKQRGKVQWVECAEEEMSVCVGSGVSPNVLARTCGSHS